MADNETSSLISDLNRQLGILSGAVGQEIKTTGLVSDAYREDTAQTKAMTKAQKEFSDSIQKTTIGVLGFAKTLQSGNGSFAPLTDVVSMTTKALGGLLGKIPFVGGALEGLVKGSGEVANMMIDTFDKVYSSFEKLSDSGVVESFDALKLTAREMGMTMTGAADVLQQRSKELALFGGSALQGTKMLKEIASKSTDLRDNFQKLGISSHDFMDFQISYINQQNILNGGKKKSTDELIAESASYMKELDAVAKLTGESRKQIQKGREERQKEASILIFLEKLTPEMREEFHKYNDLVRTKGGAALEKGGATMIARRGMANDEASLQIQRSAAESSGFYADFSKKLLDGSANASEAFDKTREIQKRAIKSNSIQATLLGKESSTTAIFVDQWNLANSTTEDMNKLNKDAIDQQEKTLKDTTSDNSKLAGTKRALEKSQINIEQLATKSGLVTGLMEKMAEGLEAVTEKFYTITGEELPAHLKAASEAREALKDELKIRKDLENLEKKEANFQKNGRKFYEATESQMASAMDDLRKKLSEATKKKDAALEKKRQEDIKAGLIVGGATTTTTAAAAPVASTAATTTSTQTDTGAYQAPMISSESISYQSNRRTGPTSNPGDRPAAPATSSGTGSRTSGSGAGYSFPDSSELSPKLATISSKTGAKTSVNAKGAAQFQRMIDWFDSIGYPIKSLGGYNNRNIAGTNTPSWHSAGLAIDINPAENPYGSRRITDMPETPDKNTGQMAQSIGLGWGANWPNIKDAMHFSLGPNEGGRLPSARTGGIFSGPDTGYLTELHGDEIVAPVGKQALNTSMLSDSSSSSDADFDAVYDKMESKLDALISAMHDNMKANKKQSMAKFA
jgi:hypothetical protein